MGDVGISLASGMNPLLVMIQQGDQIRGAIQQAGASGKQLEQAMAGAATQIATSFLQTGQAIGGFFVNAIKSAGEAIIGLPVSMLKTAFSTIAVGGTTAAAALEELKIAASAFAKVGIVALLTILVALGMEYVKVANAQKELTVALATNGAGLGLSTQQAQSLAESMKSVGINTLDAMRMIGEFANTGANAAIPLEAIVKSAKDMEKYVGIASKDTMKAFSDISEKPVEGLIKLAKTTGNVSAATILQAEAFMRAGKEAEAAKVAQEALAASNEMVTNTVKNNLDPLQKLWLDIKSAISSTTQALYDFANSNEVITVATTLWKVFASVVSTVWYAFTNLVKGLGAVGSALFSIAKGDFSAAKDTMLDFAESNKVAAKAQIENLKATWASADAKK
jgi:phage-related minor tail protein